MKFWVYSIDWRALTVEVIAELDSQQEADDASAEYIKSLDISQLTLKTIAISEATQQMQKSIEQFKRLGGRSVA